MDSDDDAVINDNKFESFETPEEIDVMDDPSDEQKDMEDILYREPRAPGLELSLLFQNDLE